MFGRTIRIVTTQNTYLSITGFEAYTGAGGSSSTSTRRVISSSSVKRGVPTMRTGGFGGFGGFGGGFRRGKSFSLSFTMGNSKVTLN